MLTKETEETDSWETEKYWTLLDLKSVNNINIFCNILYVLCNGNILYYITTKIQFIYIRKELD